MPPTETDSTLPADAHYVAVFAPYKSAEECLEKSSSPYGCRFSISLCENGRAGQRVADIVSQGTYYMLGSVAHASFTDGTTLRFDVDARIDLDGQSPNTTWVVDTDELWKTLQFDNVDCSEDR